MVLLPDFLTELLGSFSSQEIQYCFLKNHEELPARNLGRDIDILIAKPNLEKALSCIVKIDGIQIVGITHRENVTSVYIYGISWEGNTAIEIDLCTARAWRGFDYLSCISVLANVESKDLTGLIKSPSSAHDAIIYFIGHYLNTGEIKPKHTKKIRYSFKKHSNEIEDEFSSYFGRALSKKLIAMVIQNDASGLNMIHRRIKIAMVLKNFRAHPASTLKKFWAHSLTELRLRLNNCGSFTIVFLGPDGAGKSTVIQHLQNQLFNTADDIRLTHLKPTFFFNNRISERGIVTDPHSKKPRNRIFSILKICLWIVEIWIDRLCRPSKNFEVTIYDRYYDDVYIDPVRYRYGAPIQIAKLCRKFIPTPDLYFVCISPAGIIQSRKKEVSFDETQRQLAEYIRFVDEAHYKAKILDTNASIQQTTTVCLDVILEAMAVKSVKKIQ